MIAVGVDTHKERHYAVALDHLGQMLAELICSGDASAGYARAAATGPRRSPARESSCSGSRVPAAGAPAYASTCSTPATASLEVERPRRRDRRAGKSDRIDAIAAAKRVLADEHVSTPSGRGVLTALRALLIARRSAVAERTRVLNQLQALTATAPIALRERIGHGTGKQLERKILSLRARAQRRPRRTRRVRGACATSPPTHAHLGADAKRYQNQLAELVASLDQTLLDEPGIGPISAAKLLACDPTRFKSEAAFARCNGTAPIPASSGKTVRYRLNPGGDRQANNAIHTIAIIRAKHQPETRAYLERRIKEGKTKREALRSLKRHISRELYHRLAAIPLTS